MSQDEPEGERSGGSLVTDCCRSQVGKEWIACLSIYGRNERLDSRSKGQNEGQNEGQNKGQNDRSPARGKQIANKRFQTEQTRNNGLLFHLASNLQPRYDSEGKSGTQNAKEATDSTLCTQRQELSL